MDLIDFSDPSPNSAPDKMTITVQFQGTDFTVSWYSDMSERDVREAIVSACDSIIDSGFQLFDGAGTPTSIGNIRANEIYLLQPGSEPQGYGHITGDRLRRVNVEVEPLRHGEALKAVEVMKQGSNLLKHTRSGMPHIRLFQLTNDLSQVIWFTARKSHKETKLLFVDVTEVKVGQGTAAFLRYPLPLLTHLSFSLVTERRTLDLTCKDEKEFDLWVAGCKALFYASRNFFISKQVLMSHSKRFMDFLRQNHVIAATQSLSSETTSKKLEECILRKAMNKQQFDEKLLAVGRKLRELKEKALELPETGSVAEMQDYANTKGAFGEEYCEVVLDDREDEVLATQEERLRSLLDQCQLRLNEIESERDQYSFEAGKREAGMTSLESNIWKLEVDVENAADILQRVEDLVRPKWTKRVSDWIWTKVRGRTDQGD